MKLCSIMTEKICYKIIWNNVRSSVRCTFPDSKVYGDNMGPTWCKQDPGGPHVGHVNFAIWVVVRQAWTIFLIRKQNQDAPYIRGLIDGMLG